MSHLVTPNYAPDGSTMAAATRASPQAGAMMPGHSQEREQDRSIVPDAHHYDDGLVHGHAWAAPAHRR